MLLIFAATILTSYSGFKWPKIKAAIGQRFGGTWQYRPLLATIMLLLLTAYDIHDRYTVGLFPQMSWRHYGPILLGIAATIWLIVGGVSKKK